MKRTDITPQERFEIGRQMSDNPSYGEVQALAKQYNMSRWLAYQCKFIYLLCTLNYHRLSTCLSAQEVAVQLSCVQSVLSIYLNCESAISGISSVYKDFTGASISTGRVSTILNTVGSQLPSIEQLKDEDIKLCILCDEMFINNNRPILVSMCFKTGYILSMELASHRDSDSWGYVYLEITDNDTKKIQRVACDLGSGMQKAIGDLIGSSLFRYDLMHYLQPLMKSIGKLCIRINKAWASALKAEADLTDFLCSTAYLVGQKLQAETQECKKKWVKLQAKEAKLAKILAQKTQVLLDLVQIEEEMTPIILGIRDCLQITDEHGQLKTLQAVKNQLSFYLDYVSLIEWQEIKQACKKLKKNMDIAIAYFKEVQEVNTKIQLEIPAIFYQNVLLHIWQLEAKSRATKNYRYKKELKAQYLAWQNLVIQEKGAARFKKDYAKVNALLLNVVRSSSLIENLNGRIRRFDISARGQINQNRLNIIRFYLNHKKLVRSEHSGRKGFSPYQLFKDKKEDTRSWWEILQEDYLQAQSK